MLGAPIDLDRLLKLRVAIARLGETEMLGWWNSKGQLGPSGPKVLRRGFPRTHHFAQARSVFAVAAQRCTERFDPPGSVTLWQLDAATEEAFDARWETWLDHAADWTPFFESIAAFRPIDAFTMLTELGLVPADALARLGRLRRTGNSVQLPGLYGAADEDVDLLAIGFGRADRGDLAVPYARKADA